MLALVVNIITNETCLPTSANLAGGQTYTSGQEGGQGSFAADMKKETSQLWGGQMASIEVEMKADFLEEAAFLMGLEEGGLGSEETKENVLGGRDPVNKGVESEKFGTRAKSLSLSRGGCGEQREWRTGRKAPLPPFRPYYFCFTY